MKEEDRLAGRWERIKKLRDTGVGIVVSLAVAAVAFSLVKQRFVDAFSADSLTKFPMAQMPIILFAVTVLLIFLWIHATLGEYQMLSDFGSEFIPSLPRSSFPAIIGLALLLGTLCFFSDRLIVYSAIFACFKLFEIWGIWIRDSMIKAGLNHARKVVPEGDPRHEAAAIIEHYYIGTPQVQLGITVLFFSFVALILGLLGGVSSEQSTANQLLVAGYTVMSLDIAIPEIVYHKWRGKRDRALGDIYS